MQEIWVWSLAWEDSWRRKWQPTPVFSSLGNCMGRGAWWATVYGLTKSWTWRNDETTAIRPFWDFGYVCISLLILKEFRTYRNWKNNTKVWHAFNQLLLMWISYILQWLKSGNLHWESSYYRQYLNFISCSTRLDQSFLQSRIQFRLLD